MLEHVTAEYTLRTYLQNPTTSQHATLPTAWFAIVDHFEREDRVRGLASCMPHVRSLHLYFVLRRLIVHARRPGILVSARATSSCNGPIQICSFSLALARGSPTLEMREDSSRVSYEAVSSLCLPRL
jgi:hypothetical protein